MRFLPSLIISGAFASNASTFLQTRSKSKTRLLMRVGDDGDEDGEEKDDTEESADDHEEEDGNHKPRPTSGLARTLDSVSSELSQGDSGGLQQLINSLAAQKLPPNNHLKKDQNGNLYEDFTSSHLNMDKHADLKDVLGKKSSADKATEESAPAQKKVEHRSHLSDHLGEMAKFLPEGANESLQKLMTAMANKDQATIDKIIGSGEPKLKNKEDNNETPEKPMATPKVVVEASKPVVKSVKVTSPTTMPSAVVDTKKEQRAEKPLTSEHKVAAAVATPAAPVEVVPQAKVSAPKAVEQKSLKKEQKNVESQKPDSHRIAATAAQPHATVAAPVRPASPAKVETVKIQPAVHAALKKQSRQAIDQAGNPKPVVQPVHVAPVPPAAAAAPVQPVAAAAGPAAPAAKTKVTTPPKAASHASAVAPHLPKAATPSQQLPISPQQLNTIRAEAHHLANTLDQFMPAQESVAGAKAAQAMQSLQSAKQLADQALQDANAAREKIEAQVEQAHALEQQEEARVAQLQSKLDTVEKEKQTEDAENQDLKIKLANETETEQRLHSAQDLFEGEKKKMEQEQAEFVAQIAELKTQLQEAKHAEATAAAALKRENGKIEAVAKAPSEAIKKMEKKLISLRAKLRVANRMIRRMKKPKHVSAMASKRHGKKLTKFAKRRNAAIRKHRQQKKAKKANGTLSQEAAMIGRTEDLLDDSESKPQFMKMIRQRRKKLAERKEREQKSKLAAKKRGEEAKKKAAIKEREMVVAHAVADRGAKQGRAQGTNKAARDRMLDTERAVREQEDAPSRKKAKVEALKAQAHQEQKVQTLHEDGSADKPKATMGKKKKKDKKTKKHAAKSSEHSEDETKKEEKKEDDPPLEKVAPAIAPVVSKALEGVKKVAAQKKQHAKNEEKGEEKAEAEAKPEQQKRLDSIEERGEQSEEESEEQTADERTATEVQAVAEQPPVVVATAAAKQQQAEGKGEQTAEAAPEAEPAQPKVQERQDADSDAGDDDYNDEAMGSS